MKVYNPNAIGVTTGFGVPTGGTSGQYLVKNSATNYDAVWSTSVGTVPTWIAAGTIQGVGLIGTTTTPVIPTSATVNQVYYRRLGSKTWEVMGIVEWPNNTGANNGSGEYVLTLPAGLSFDTSLPYQITQQDTGNQNNHMACRMMGSDSLAKESSTVTQGNSGIIIWSSTQYRVFLPRTGTTWQCWNSSNFSTNNNVSTRIMWRFEFQTP